MKRTLLLATLALASGSLLFAQETTDVTPAVYGGQPIVAMSPDGNWLVANDQLDGPMTIYNVATGEKFECDPSGFYCAGYGNSVSNTGVVLSSTNEMGDDASYWEAGQWHALPVQDTDLGYNTAHGITPDGSRICGNISRTGFGDTSSVMSQPVVWNRNAEGEYDMYVELPYPEKDYTNQTPQYVTALCISDDGKTVVGQIVDCQGFITLPIVYNLTDEGWIYYMPQPQFTDVELPEPPSNEVPYPDMYDYATEEEIAAYNAAYEAYVAYWAAMPEQADFMTDEEFEAYMAAMDAFWDDPENNSYPMMDDFMTAEELAAYDAAKEEFYANAPEYPSLLNYMTEEEQAAYNAAFDAYMAYQDELGAWLEAYEEAIQDIPNFLFNQSWLSPNGRYVFATKQVGNYWSSDYTPCRFDLVDKTYIMFDNETDMMAKQVFDDGSLLTCSPVMGATRNAFICIAPQSAEVEFTALQDYVNQKNPLLYQWMEKKMRHTYDTYDYEYDDEEDTYVEVTIPHENEWITGTPMASADMTVFTSFVTTIWDADYTWGYQSYYMPINCTSGKMDITAKDVNVNTFIGGVIAITGEVKSVDVYDLNGQKVFSTSAVAPKINTGLQHGLYIVKTTAANGAVIITKAAF